jgi:hypothetical protein
MILFPKVLYMLVEIESSLKPVSILYIHRPKKRKTKRKTKIKRKIQIKIKLKIKIIK